MNQIPSLPTYGQATATTQLILKTTFTSGSLYLPPHVLITQTHKPASSQHPLCHHTHLIYGPIGHLYSYGVLPLIDIFIDWP